MWMARGSMLRIHITKKKLEALAKHTFPNSVDKILGMGNWVTNLICEISSLVTGGVGWSSAPTKVSCAYPTVRRLRIVLDLARICSGLLLGSQNSEISRTGREPGV